MPLLSSIRVAPHAGAWIETIYSKNLTASSASRLTQARGLKQPLKPCCLNSLCVAPHAGAWIETAPQVLILSCPLSRLTQARGLKLCKGDNILLPSSVAPHAGAWIETLSFLTSARNSGVAPHAGAWIETVVCAAFPFCQGSRLTQARGLKP